MKIFLRLINDRHMKSILALLVFINTIVFSQQSPTQKTTAMKLEDVYTVFICKDLIKTAAFYQQWLGFTPLFESSFFVLLGSPGEKSFNLGLMSEVHPSSPPSNPAMTANAGAFLTLQTSDAKTDYEKLKGAGLSIYYHLKDEPWGQRRFGIIDPNGMYVDIVQQIDPQPGFWDKYIKTN